MAGSVQAQQKATPKAGEGISTFLLRHNRSPKKYYDDFVELNKQKLGKNNVLKMGVTYVIPPVKRSSGTSAKPAPAKKTAGKEVSTEDTVTKSRTSGAEENRYNHQRTFIREETVECESFFQPACRCLFLCSQRTRWP